MTLNAPLALAFYVMAPFTVVHGSVQAADVVLDMEDHQSMASALSFHLNAPEPTPLQPRGRATVPELRRLLVVASNAASRSTVVSAVQRAWRHCQVATARTETEAMRLLWRDAPDVIILDLSEEFRSFYLCQRIREYSSAGLVVLGESGDASEKVHTLRSGADDYLTKPYDTTELLARLEALGRRVAAGRAAEQSVPAPPLIAGDLRIDFTTREVRRRGAVVQLTRTEFRLLATLARAADTVLPHDVLMERVWGPGYVADTHYLKVFVRRLGRKLGDDPAQPTYIGTSWGRGYRFIARTPTSASDRAA